MHERHKQPTSNLASPRERIDRAAYDLFSHYGIDKVGVDTVSATAGVAKMTLYKHYPSKEALVLAFLRRREELWTHSWLEKEVERRAHGPAERLLATFDVLDEWFRQADFEGCSFMKVLLETSATDNPVRKAARDHLGTVRVFLTRLAKDAGVRRAAAFAREWQMLMMGAIMAAHAGDKEAALRGREMGLLLLEREGIESK